MKLYIAEKQIHFNQEFEILQQMMNSAFGKPAAQERVIEPKTGAEALAGFRKIFG